MVPKRTSLYELSTQNYSLSLGKKWSRLQEKLTSRLWRTFDLSLEVMDGPIFVSSASLSDCLGVRPEVTWPHHHFDTDVQYCEFRNVTLHTAPLCIFNLMLWHLQASCIERMHGAWTFTNHVNVLTYNERRGFKRRQCCHECCPCLQVIRQQKS
jgi:hypothetical protein